MPSTYVAQVARPRSLAVFDAESGVEYDAFLVLGLALTRVVSQPGEAHARPRANTATDAHAHVRMYVLVGVDDKGKCAS